MCRRWAGGPLFAVRVGSIDWKSEGAVQVVKSSAWAERGFCKECGSGLFYRVTAEGNHHGVTTITLGTLDDQSGINLTTEWFIDRKPDAYALAGERKRVTAAEVMAMFGG